MEESSELSLCISLGRRTGCHCYGRVAFSYHLLGFIPRVSFMPFCCSTFFVLLLSGLLFSDIAFARKRDEIL